MADEQVGNNSYITMTPGSAVAGQLQNILTQKRLEARQDMLDSITAQNVASQIRDRDENTRATSEYREANADNRRAQELARRAGLYSPGTAMDQNSDDYKYFQKEAPALIIPGKPETPQFDYEGQPSIPATGPTFKGLPAQIEISRKAKEHQDALDQFNSPEFATFDRTKKAAIYRILTGSEPNDDIIEGRKPVHSQIYNEYQDYVNSIPKGETPLSFSKYQDVDANRKLPKPVAEKGTYLDRPVMVNGVEDPTKAYFVENGKLTIQNAPDGTTIGNKRGPVAKPIQIPSATMAKYGALKAAMVPKPSMFESVGVGPTPPSPQVVKDFNTFQSMEASNLARGQSPEFQALVQHTFKELQDPKTPKNMSDDDIIKHYLDKGVVLSPSEQNNLRILLGSLR